MNYLANAKLYDSLYDTLVLLSAACIAHYVWGHWIFQGMMGGWVVVDHTHGGFFIEYMIISYC